MIELYNDDCMAVMANYPDKYFDLAITDPPYGINVANMAYTQESNRPCKQKNGGSIIVKKKKYNKSNWDKTPPSINWLTELQRVSKHQIIWGINYMNFNLDGGRLIWHKLVAEGVSFSDSETAYCSMFDAVEDVYFRWAGMIQGIYCGKDISKAMIQQGNKKLNEVRIHQTQKPVALYKWLLSKYAKNGDKILDTHGGSMSSVIACIDGGFDMVCSELDESYFQNAVNRIDKHVSQMDMFIERPDIKIYKPIIIDIYV